ncbi:MAG: ExbD/TolR family protein [Chlamydiota bacterium]
MYRRGKLINNREPEETGINLTPLIDVVFVVLIMFIVIAPMLELDKVILANASQSPQKSSTSVRDRSSISIHVHHDDTIWYNKQMISLSQLKAELRDAKNYHPHEMVQLFHDKRASFGTYQSIKNIVEATGFEEMDVILQPG